MSLSDKLLPSFLTSMSTPGFIAGAVVLECPRAVDPHKGPRHVVFDANFCIVRQSESITMGLLRFFASTEMATEIQKMAEKQYQKAFVVATVFSFLYYHYYKSSISLISLDLPLPTTFQ